MLVLGLAGQAGVGKDEVALYLAKRYGFVVFAFSDALYHELAQSYGLQDQNSLRDRRYKEMPVEALSLGLCTDEAFVKVAREKLSEENPDTFFDLDALPLSPRWLLQTWGGEYRRTQDENYWIKKAEAFVEQLHYLPPYPELRPSFFVECGTRYPNEQEWIRSVGGQIWHIHRGEDKVLHDHASAQPLPVLAGERELWNNGSIEYLHQGIDLLMSSSARTVRVESPLPMEEQGKTETADADA